MNDMKIKSKRSLSNFAHLNFQSKVYLFNSHYLSLYGCELFNLENNGIIQLCTEWRVCGRRIAGRLSRTHSFLIVLIYLIF